MNPIAAAWYVAGVFDGEGHVEGWRDGDVTNRRVVVTNTDQDIVEMYCRCLDVLGIAYRLRSRRDGRLGRRGTEVIVQRIAAVQRFAQVVPVMSQAKRRRIDALTAQLQLEVV